MLNQFENLICHSCNSKLEIFDCDYTLSLIKCNYYMLNCPSHSKIILDNNLILTRYSLFKEYLIENYYNIYKIISYNNECNGFTSLLKLIISKKEFDDFHKNEAYENILTIDSCYIFDEILNVKKYFPLFIENNKICWDPIFGKLKTYLVFK